MSKTFRGVVFRGVRDIRVEDRPFPDSESLSDSGAIVKDYAEAIYMSEAYRGHEPRRRTGFVIGHEFVGIVLQVGRSIQNFKPGDHVIAPFTSSCGKCFYCLRGFTSRCEHCGRFGAEDLDGGQAEIVLVPHADTTLFHLPAELNPDLAIFMADIFPTGWYAATSALKDLTPDQLKTDTVVVIGSGPIGLMATIVARTLGAKNLYAIESNPERLKLAEKHGAKPLSLGSNPQEAILALTEGRGADVVIEAVGHGDAMRLAFDLLRPFGLIVCIGVPQDPIPFSGPECYAKNLRIQFGRCPVRHVFNGALSTLLKIQNELTDFVEVWPGLEDAPKAYALFDKGQVGKIVFDLTAQS